MSRKKKDRSSPLCAQHKNRNRKREARKQIRTQQKLSQTRIEHVPFMRLVREITKEILDTEDMRFQSSAIELLKRDLESFCTRALVNARTVAETGKRVIVYGHDLEKQNLIVHHAA
jgi:histone H3/H4